MNIEYIMTSHKNVIYYPPSLGLDLLVAMLANSSNKYILSTASLHFILSLNRRRINERKSRERSESFTHTSI